METVLDQTTEGDLADFISDLKVITAGCQAHIGQITAGGTLGVLGGAESELCEAFLNAMAASPEIERLLLCLIALRRQAPPDRSVQ